MSIAVYAVTWCETDANNKRVKWREEYKVENWGYPGLAEWEAQKHAKRLRNCGYAACVEEIK